MKRLLILNLSFIMFVASARTFAAAIESGEEHSIEESVFANQSKNAKDAVKGANEALKANTKAIDFARAQENVSEVLLIGEKTQRELTLENLAVLVNYAKDRYAQTVPAQPNAFDSAVLKDAVDSVKRTNKLIEEHNALLKTDKVRLLNQYIEKTTKVRGGNEFGEAFFKKVIEDTLEKFGNRGSVDQDVDQMQSISEVGNSILNNIQIISRLQDESQIPSATLEAIESQYLRATKPIREKIEKLEERNDRTGESLLSLIGWRLREYRIESLREKMEPIAAAFGSDLRVNEVNIRKLYENLKAEKQVCEQQLQMLQNLFKLLDAKTKLIQVSEYEFNAAKVHNKLLLAYQNLILSQERLIATELVRVRGRLLLIEAFSNLPE